MPCTGIQVHVVYLILSYSCLDKFVGLRARRQNHWKLHSLGHFAARLLGTPVDMGDGIANIPRPKFQQLSEKTKGQQLKGKSVQNFSQFFTLFHDFSPGTFPFKTKGCSSMRTKEKKR